MPNLHELDNVEITFESELMLREIKIYNKID